jgi:hypothetical protein
MSGYYIQVDGVPVEYLAPGYMHSVLLRQVPDLMQGVAVAPVAGSPGRVNLVVGELAALRKVWSYFVAHPIQFGAGGSMATCSCPFLYSTAADAVAIMRDKSKNQWVQVAALVFLAEYIRDRADDVPRQDVLACGGVPVVIGALLAHQLSETVQHTGCQVLAWLCRNTTNIRGEVVAAGGIQAIVSALDAQPHSPGVRLYGFGALQNIADGNEANTAIIVSSGGLGAVLAALQVRPSDNDILAFGCLTLSSLASRNPAIAAAIGENNGVAIVIAALCSNVNCAFLQSCGIKALADLSSHNKDNRNQMISGGALETIASALQAHPNFEKIYDYGTWTLTNLFESPSADLRVRAEALGIRALLLAAKSSFRSLSRKIDKLTWLMSQTP